MTKEERLYRIKTEIRQSVVCAIFDQLVRTHLAAMEVSQERGEFFTHSSHIWEIDRVQSIWTISCKGLYDWNVSFDVDWFTGPCGDRYQSIDTFVFNENPIADTQRHLTMALEFVSHYMANTNPDGSVIL